MMDRWLITYRRGAVQLDKAEVLAHRVEGWTGDYAFFGHVTDTKVVTHLIPREIVLCVYREDRGRAPDADAAVRG